MPNTTNFNWPTPADTDLVKDGAAAIRNLGDGVDTSLVDLKGGTTGQILSKASNADMDFAFITPNVGDLTEVQAGTGISVADGTGPIPVVTNTVATAFDAKGDLVVGTGADTFAKLTVGTNGHTLVADSVETTGLKWVAPAAPAFVGCSVRGTAQQSIATATETAITFNTDVIDTHNFHDTSSNSERFTVPVGYAGKYRTVYNSRFDINSTGGRSFGIYVNGSNVNGVGIDGNAADEGNSYGPSFCIDMIRELAEGDYVELRVFQDSGVSLNFIKSYNGMFTFQFLGA
jgi:hypothetical protein